MTSTPDEIALRKIAADILDGCTIEAPLGADIESAIVIALRTARDEAWEAGARAMRDAAKDRAAAAEAKLARCRRALLEIVSCTKQWSSGSTIARAALAQINDSPAQEGAKP